MTERLAVPAWKTPPTPLSSWVTSLEAQGLDVVVTRESATVHWLDLPGLGLRGYAVTEGTTVEAINFELDAPDPAPAQDALERAAASLGWEVHDDPDEDDDEDD